MTQQDQNLPYDLTLGSPEALTIAEGQHAKIAAWCLRSNGSRSPLGLCNAATAADGVPDPARESLSSLATCIAAAAQIFGAVPEQTTKHS